MHAAHLRTQDKLSISSHVHQVVQVSAAHSFTWCDQSQTVPASSRVKLKLKQESKAAGHEHIYRQAGGQSCPRRLRINRNGVNESEYSR